MVINKKIGLSSKAMTPLDPLDAALEALHFGFRGLTVEADCYLAKLGLSRVHHRILYVIARIDRITVGELSVTLGVSKQALHRPLATLKELGYVSMNRDVDKHRFKLLALTSTGKEVEQEASQHERNAIATAFAEVSPQGKEEWYRIMQSLATHLD